MNSNRQVSVSASGCQPKKSMVLPTSFGAAPKIVSKSVEPISAKIEKMPSAKPKSPTRLTTKALIAAAFADGRSYQNPINRYEHTPTPSQPKKSCTRFDAVTSMSIEKVKSER